MSLVHDNIHALTENRNLKIILISLILFNFNEVHERPSKKQKQKTNYRRHLSGLDIKFQAPALYLQKRRLQTAFPHC